MPRALLSSPLPRTLMSLSLVALAVLALLVTVGRGPVVPAAAAPAPVGHVTGAHLTAPQAATAGTADVRAGSQYAFATIVAGKPVRWNPCAPIHWRANVSRGPVGGLAVLKAAVASVAAATGTTWVYDGTSTAIPSSSALPTTASQVRPVLIGWADATTSNLLRGQPARTLAMTRTSWFGVQSPTGTVAATRGAVIALDRTDRLPLRGAVSWSAVALHELGHAMGLAHPSDHRVLMAATMPATTSGWTAGDRAGLSLVGRGQGCVRIPGA